MFPTTEQLNSEFQFFEEMSKHMGLEPDENPDMDDLETWYEEAVVNLYKKVAKAKVSDLSKATVEMLHFGNVQKEEHYNQSPAFLKMEEKMSEQGIHISYILSNNAIFSVVPDEQQSGYILEIIAKWDN